MCAGSLPRTVAASSRCASTSTSPHSRPSAAEPAWSSWPWVMTTRLPGIAGLEGSETQPDGGGRPVTATMVKARVQTGAVSGTAGDVDGFALDVAAGPLRAAGLELMALASRQAVFSGGFSGICCRGAGDWRRGLACGRERRKNPVRVAVPLLPVLPCAGFFAALVSVFLRGVK